MAITVAEIVVNCDIVKTG